MNRKGAFMSKTKYYVLAVALVLMMAVSARAQTLTTDSTSPLVCATSTPSCCCSCCPQTTVTWRPLVDLNGTTATTWAVISDTAWVTMPSVGYLVPNRAYLNVADTNETSQLTQRIEQLERQVELLRSQVGKGKR